MKRTVLVTDDTGKEYEPTFEKRARGLCKKGRARWIGKDAICLAAPPDHDFRKDSDMSENIIPAAPSMSADYILAHI